MRTVGIRFADRDTSDRGERRDGTFRARVGACASASLKLSGSRCKPVLIEMKWGDGAYGGKAGIIQHLRDIESILSDKNEIAKIRKMIELQFDQLSDLRLLRFNRNEAVKRIDLTEHPEVVFILANHNPRSTKLRTVLDSIEQPDNFDLRFFVASFAGYGMHEACMLKLDEFRELVARFPGRRSKASQGGNRV